MKVDAGKLHRESIVFDGHCDTLLAVLTGKRRLGERSSEGLPRMREGGVTAQIFAICTCSGHLPGGPLKQALRMLDAFYRELEDNPDSLVLATSATDIERAKREGRVAAILGLEGAEPLEGDLGVLRMLHRLGVRVVGLTWNRRNQAADGVNEAGGLTNFGVALVRELNRLGMVIDVAHLAPAGVRDVLELSEAPVIASHANAYALCPHRRNLTDEQLEAIAAKGGVVGVTFVPRFVAEGGEGASLGRLLDHIDHVAKVAGIDHVGLGSDFDGFADRPMAGLEDVTKLPNVTAGLLGRGYSPAEVQKVLGGNFLRVFREVVG